MKINKISLAISHFFGYRKDEEHFDNVSIRFPFMIIDDLKIVITDGVKYSIYEELRNNPKLERRCANVQTIYIVDEETKLVEILLYVDGTIYTRDENIASNRALKLKELEI